MAQEGAAAAVSEGGNLELVLADESATVQLAVSLSAVLSPGDMVTLSGDLGSGKTTFARALIRHFAGDETLEVPSPTFTLMQIYDLPGGAVAHADLYRVQGPMNWSRWGSTISTGTPWCWWSGPTGRRDFSRPTGSTWSSCWLRTLARDSGRRALRPMARWRHASRA